MTATETLILKEKIYKFKDKKNLYIYLIEDDGTFYVDVTNLKANFGRMILDSKKNATLIFNILSKLIDESKDYLSACYVSDSTLRMDGTEKFADTLLKVYTMRNKVGRDEINLLAHVIDADLEEYMSITGTETITVLNKNVVAIGKFVRLLEDEKFMFLSF